MSPGQLIIGASPDQIFDLSGLLASEPPLAEAPQIDELEVIRGSGLFDATWYLDNHPELGEAGIDLLSHYHEAGWRQGWRPNLYFDPTWYREQNPDVREADLDPLLHYIRLGESQRRRPVPHFDPVWYRATYALSCDEPSLRHFLERRHSGAVSPIAEFDSAWYLETYPDVAEAGMDPVEHYMIQGYMEARNPSPRFDTRFYRQRYLNGASDENPLLHYLRHRNAQELRTCLPEYESTIPREVRRFSQAGPEFEAPRPLPSSAPRLCARLLSPAVPRLRRERCVVGPRLHRMDQRDDGRAELSRALSAARAGGSRSLRSAGHGRVPRAGGAGAALRRRWVLRLCLLS